MSLNKWLRTKIYRSVDPEKVRRVEEASESVSREARRLKQRVAEPDARDMLASVIQLPRNGKGHA